MANTTQTTRRDEGTMGQHGQQHGQPIKNRAEEMASTAADKAKSAAGGIVDAAKDVAGTVADKARDAASTVAKGVGNAASFVGHKAEDATEAVGHGMRNLGSTIKDKGPESGMLGSATSTVGGALESAGEYLEEQGLGGIGRDITNMIRRYPFAALCVGISMGYLLARATRS
jgi:hypothetical protein